MKYHLKVDKSYIIEAFQYNGDLITKDGWCVPDWAVRAFLNGTIYYDSKKYGSPPCDLYIKKSDNFKWLVNIGDYVIHEADGGIGSCPKVIFERTYTTGDNQ